MVLDERSILAADADAAIKEAVSLPRRPGVRSLRLVDLDGREIFERSTPTSSRALTFTRDRSACG
jgi:hypothetical protein